MNNRCMPEMHCLLGIALFLRSRVFLASGPQSSQIWAAIRKVWEALAYSPRYNVWVFNATLQVPEESID